MRLCNAGARPYILCFPGMKKAPCFRKVLFSKEDKGRFSVLPTGVKTEAAITD